MSAMPPASCLMSNCPGPACDSSRRMRARICDTSVRRVSRRTALHSTRCPDCEGELRQLEHLQDAVASHIAAVIDDLDISQVWGGIAPRLAARVPSLRDRLRAWWDERDLGWMVRGPVFAAVAAAIMLAFAVWLRLDNPALTHEIASRIDNSAVLDSVQSSVDSVALVTDAETNTTLLWVMDDSAAALDQAADQWDGLK